jgi:hypothetical protein
MIKLSDYEHYLVNDLIYFKLQLNFALSYVFYYSTKKLLAFLIN